MPSQRPFFLTTFFAAFRQQPPTSLASSSNAGQPTKHNTTASGSAPYGHVSSSTARTVTSSATASSSTSSATSATVTARSAVLGQLPLHSPRAHHVIPIPQANGGRRRGSDSSSEGFRDALGAEKMYIGGRTAGGEEKFFKLGVVRRVRSGDRLSLDRMSL